MCTSLLTKKQSCTHQPETSQEPSRWWTGAPSGYRADGCNLWKGGV